MSPSGSSFHRPCGEPSGHRFIKFLSASLSWLGTLRVLKNTVAHPPSSVCSSVWKSPSNSTTFPPSSTMTPDFIPSISGCSSARFKNAWCAVMSENCGPSLASKPIRNASPWKGSRRRARQSMMNLKASRSEQVRPLFVGTATIRCTMPTVSLILSCEPCGVNSTLRSSAFWIALLTDASLRRWRRLAPRGNLLRPFHRPRADCVPRG